MGFYRSRGQDFLLYLLSCLKMDTKNVSFPNLAPELIAFNEQQKIPYQKIPPHNPACERVFHEGAPLIVSPNEGSEYYIRKDEPQQIQLACHTSNDVQEVFWYINDKLSKKARAPRK
jgi:penicillin-binding protein 1C